MNGILDLAMGAAIANFQSARDLAVTSAVDEATVEASALAWAIYLKRGSNRQFLSGIARSYDRGVEGRLERKEPWT